ncbi:MULTISPECIES: hypothetical protein [Paenibacillus]|uniref:hypothetical protein n=1 Tax=Paenibacillus TaxID=44249 RepID=UPI002FDFA14F
MDMIVARYFEVKQRMKELEQELAELRERILEHCRERQITGLELAQHTVRVIHQARREYDENKLYEALPDLELWRLLSKPDTAKIAGLLKLNVITEEKIKHTYRLKDIALLQVDKR